MDIFELIQKRRSIFPVQYNDTPIDKETIAQILEAANWAPTHKKTEPWRFKVLQGEKKKKLGVFLSEKYQEVDAKPKQIKIKKLQENPARAAAIIAICMQRDPNESLPEWEELAATAMAVQNMWLCCTELGIGSYWSSPGLIQYMDEFFDLNEGEKCFGFFYMGYYDDGVDTSGRTSIEEKVEWFD
ncbi:MAG: nitroreductase [Bacteroidota bacterium]